MIDTDIFSDTQIFAKTLDGEAANQGYLGQQGVASVILNRVAARWQGETTARGICLHRKQFDCWLPGADRDRIMLSTNPQCLDIANLALAGGLTDNTNGADSYYDNSISPPYWAKGLVPSATINRLIFFITRKI